MDFGRRRLADGLFPLADLLIELAGAGHALLIHGGEAAEQQGDLPDSQQAEADHAQAAEAQGTIALPGEGPRFPWFAAGIGLQLQKGGQAQQGHTQQGEGRRIQDAGGSWVAQASDRGWAGSAAAITNARKARIKVRPQVRATIGSWGLRARSDGG